MKTRIEGDFNGLFGDLLCISHEETATADNGDEVTLAEGMELLVFEADAEAGKPVFLVASGHAIPSPPELQCNGSRWSLKIDNLGVRHVVSLDGT